MAIKVELASRVWSYLRDRFTTAERDAFVERLGEIRREPIKKSEPSREPSLSKYLLRFFRFGSGDRWMAVFEYDIARDRIRVLECRLLRPRRQRRDGRGNQRSPG
jgi:hypothetical protein